jgi:phage shock protein A
MSKFNIEEVKAMSPEEQVVELDKQIQNVKDTRDQNTANIRHLEEVNENLNQQLETLIELKWNCKFQQRLHEWMGDMDDVVNPANEYE